MKKIADVLVVTKQTVIKFLNVSEGVSATYLFSQYTFPALFLLSNFPIFLIVR